MSLNRKKIFECFVSSPEDFISGIDLIKNQLSLRVCILLQGDLAAGKTTFVQRFCQTYNITGVVSPTFSLHQVYQNEKIKIDHFDLYRLSASEEIETSGIWDVLAEPAGLVFIEWPGRISESELPLSWDILEIQLTKVTENHRHLILSRLFS